MREIGVSDKKYSIFLSKTSDTFSQREGGGGGGAHRV